MEPATTVSKRFFKPGFFMRRRQILLPTWRLSALVAIVIGLPAAFAFLNAYDWLVVNEPVPGAPSVIVEGWMPDYALQDAAAYAGRTGAQVIYCTGTPLERGTLDLPYDTHAAYAAAALEKIGVSPEKIHAAPCKFVRTERTRSMARALRDHLRDNPPPIADRRINLITLATHGRRSRKIFRKELGPDWQIGVVSLPDPEMTSSRWFLSSNSAKAVLSEVIALTLGIVGVN